MSSGEVMRAVKPENQVYALGLAVRLMFPLETFASLRFGNWVGMLAGQIERNHYFFVLEGEAVRGYAGWGEVSEDVAKAWLSGERDPGYRECLAGNIMAVFAWHAQSGAVNRFMRRRVEELAVDKKAVVFLRRYRDGRRRIVRLEWTAGRLARAAERRRLRQ